MPSPPVWIVKRMTTCPKGDQNVAVSTLVRPVTVIADVAVNTASGHEAAVPLSVARGSFSSPANTPAARRNTRIAARAGERRMNTATGASSDQRRGDAGPAYVARGSNDNSG